MKKNFPKVSGKVITLKDKRAGEKVLRESGFLLTVNTNTIPKSGDEAERMGNELKDTIKDLLEGSDANGEPKIKRLIKFVGERASDEYGTESVKEIKYEIGIELGTHPKGGRVHAHVAIYIKHYSKIHLNTDEIQGFINNETGYDTHVNVKYIGGYDALERYISKRPLLRDIPKHINI